MRATQRKQSRFRRDLRNRWMLTVLNTVLRKAMVAETRRIVGEILREKILDHVREWKQRAAADPLSYEAHTMQLYDIDMEAQFYLDRIDRFIA